MNKNNTVSTTSILLVCLSIVSHCEVYYIGPSQLLDDANHHLTLSQFIQNSSDYLRNNTQLIFAPGNYSLESKVLVENVHSFTILSMESMSSSRAVIICDHNGKFEFRKVNIVTVSALNFIGCFDNYVMSVGHFQMEHSRFYGEAVVNGTVLTIDESSATLDGVAFISTVRVSTQRGAAYVNLSESCPTDSLLPERAMVILSRKSIMVITQSWFEGNSIGLGRVVENYDSDATILNTTFAENSAATHCYNNCCFIGGLVYSSSSQGNYVKIYDSNFVQNIGVMIFTLANNMLISRSKFFNNNAPIALVFATDSNQLAIEITGYNVFINHNEPVMQTQDSENSLIMNISHSAFIGNNAPLSVVGTNGKVILSVDHNRFTDNIGGIVLIWNGSTVDIAYSEFINNSGSLSPSSMLLSTGTLISFNGDQISVSHCEFINNRVDPGAIDIQYYVLSDKLTITTKAFTVIARVSGEM